MKRRIELAIYRLKARYRYLSGRAWLAEVIRHLAREKYPTEGTILYRQELERRFIGLYGRRPRWYDGRFPWP